MHYLKYIIITGLIGLSMHTLAIQPGADTLLHHIGEIYGGGVIFHIDKTGKHGLICSMSDIMLSESSALSRSPDQKQLFTRSKITQSISITNARIATKICEGYINSDFGKGVFSDWFLPDIEQLEIMYRHRSEINKAIEDFKKDTSGLLHNSYYWSSTNLHDEQFPGNFIFNFENGNRINTDWPSPDVVYYVRAIRAF